MPRSTGWVTHVSQIFSTPPSMGLRDPRCQFLRIFERADIQRGNGSILQICVIC